MIGVVPGIHQVMHHQPMIQSDRNLDKLVCGDSVLDSRLSLKALNGGRQFLVYFAEQSNGVQLGIIGSQTLPRLQLAV
jgi:hypothetical protein